MYSFEKTGRFLVKVKKDDSLNSTYSFLVNIYNWFAPVLEHRMGFEDYFPT